MSSLPGFPRTESISIKDERAAGIVENIAQRLVSSVINIYIYVHTVKLLKYH